MQDTAREARINSTTFFYGPQHIDVQVLADRQVFTYIRPVRTLDVVWKTYREQWLIGTVIRESGNFVISTRLDDNDFEVDRGKRNTVHTYIDI